MMIRVNGAGEPVTPGRAKSDVNRGIEVEEVILGRPVNRTKRCDCPIKSHTVLDDDSISRIQPKLHEDESNMMIWIFTLLIGKSI
jgi:hypothetical protein